MYRFRSATIVAVVVIVSLSTNVASGDKEAVQFPAEETDEARDAPARCHGESLWLIGTRKRADR